MHKSVKIAFFWIIMVFVGLFTATYVTIQYANRDPIQVISEDYYEKGINYASVVQEQQQLIAEGYAISGTLFEKNREIKAGMNPLILTITKNGKPVNNAEMKIKIERGATDKYNKTIVLKEKSSGVFSGELNIPEEGPWFVTVSCMIEKRGLVKSKRIYAEK